MRIPIKTVYLLLLLSFAYACNGSGNPPVNNVPSLSVKNVIQKRGTFLNSTFRFYISLSVKNTTDISINYKTVDGTALAGKDYTALSGTLNIPANQSSAYIDVTVLPDSLRQPDQTFYLELSSAKNATISGSGKATATIQNTGNYIPVDSTGYYSASSYSGKSLAWSDEFDGNTLNPANWTYDIGGSGWGNNELEYYTNSSNNSFVSNGFLVIEARKETYGTNNYTSARILSKDKKSFTYGRIDIRAKLPKGQGIWPALWMLGSNIGSLPWPACGEIDIMELLGHEPQKVYGTAHWGAAGGPSTHIGGNYSLSATNFNEKFHVFSLDWTTTKLSFLVDDQVYFTANQSQVTGAYPFDKPFFFIMNVAVGGNWPGNPDNNTVFPQRMIVDYVRVFQ